MYGRQVCLFQPQSGLSVHVCVSSPLETYVTLVVIVLLESDRMPSAFDVEKPSVVTKSICAHPSPQDEFPLEMVMSQMSIMPVFPWPS